MSVGERDLFFQSELRAGLTLSCKVHPALPNPSKYLWRHTGESAEHDSMQTRKGSLGNQVSQAPKSYPVFLSWVNN